MLCQAELAAQRSNRRRRCAHSSLHTPDLLAQGWEEGSECKREAKHHGLAALCKHLKAERGTE